METDIYYLNSLQETGKLKDLFEPEEAPIFVLEAFKRLERHFCKDTLIEYFNAIDQWEEMVQDDYIGDVCEVIQEDEDKIIVEFSDPVNPKIKDTCSYFLA